MKLVVLSGKGGVGKSSITSSLAVLLARKKRIVAVDCDADTPNLGLCLGLLEKDFKKETLKTTERAALVEEKCIHCRKCVSTCQFSAIKWENNLPVFDEMLCEGCGACQLVCPANAIAMKKVENGWLGVAEREFPVVSGQLKIGQSGSGEIVALAKEKAEAFEHDIMLIDSAAGIGCQVIASITGADYVIAVTEPTPSALSDLKRALEVVEHFKIPYGIVINKADLNPKQTKIIRDFAAGKGIKVLGEIPYDRAFVEAIVRLEPPVVYKPELEPLFQGVLDKALAGARHG